MERSATIRQPGWPQPTSEVGEKPTTVFDQAVEAINEQHSKTPKDRATAVWVFGTSKSIRSATTGHENTKPSPTLAVKRAGSTPSEPAAEWNTATGANPEHGYRNLTRPRPEVFEAFPQPSGWAPVAETRPGNSTSSSSRLLLRGLCPRRLPRFLVQVPPCPSTNPDKH